MTVGAAKDDDLGCLGMVETCTVPSGLAAFDALVKEAPVVILHARPIEPAKYLVVFEGEVEAVRRAVLRARFVAEGRVIADLILPHPHTQVHEALKAPRKARYVDALGALQTTDACSAVESADAAAKTGEIEIVEIRLAMGLSGHGFFTMIGEVSSVQSALDAARDVAIRRGALHDLVLIPRVDPEAAKLMGKPQAPFSDFGS